MRNGMSCSVEDVVIVFMNEKSAGDSSIQLSKLIRFIHKLNISVTMCLAAGKLGT
jgi:hypothetical protein